MYRITVWKCEKEKRLLRERGYCEEERLLRGREATARKRDYCEEERLLRGREATAGKRGYCEEERLLWGSNLLLSVHWYSAIWAKLWKHNISFVTSNNNIFNNVSIWQWLPVWRKGNKDAVYLKCKYVVYLHVPFDPSLSVLPLPGS